MTDRLRRSFEEIAVSVVPALITAALHLGIVTLRREVFNTALWDWNTRDVGWVVPAGYILVFALCAVPLAIVAGVRRAGIPTRARVWFWSALSAFAVLLLFPRVYSFAWLLVALGIGYQAAALVVRHPVGSKRWIRRTGFALGIGFAVYTAITLALRTRQERRLLSVLPKATADAPNILLIIWDTARAQSMSLYGHHRPTTPFLDSLAPQAVVFDHAYSVTSWTLPSHASMLTGEYPGRLTADWTSRLDGTPPTLPETLYEQGYTTGGFVANFFAASYPTGLHRGFVRYADTKRTLTEVLLGTTLTQARSVLGPYLRIVKQRWYGQALRDLLRFNFRPVDAYQVHDRKTGAGVTAEFLRWHASAQRPYFAMLNYMEAHAGSTAPTRGMFAGGATREDEYDGAIWWLDQELRRLVSELERRGELQRTVVIVTSDHGEQFGEHGMHGHGVSLYAPVLHVPLIIYAPGRVRGGLRITRTVSLRDIARTVQDLAGATSRLLPGHPLTALATNPDAPSSPVISQVSKGINQTPDVPIHWGDLTSILDDTLHVIRDGKGAIEAYAYRTDVEEKNNLARDPMRRELSRQLLERVLRDAGLALRQRGQLQVKE